MSEASVAVFDSGLGGLSVARWLRAEAPQERLLYIGDTAWCPYGGRPPEEIRMRSLAVGRYARDRGAKALVVACNTASAAALDDLREALDIPVVGMEPAVKPAAEATAVGRVGVMATPATLGADRFDRLMARFARDVEVVPVACPGLVELVEEGVVRGERVSKLLEPLLARFTEAGVDTVVLGCTHYPFLAETIQEILGPGVTLVDPGPAVARHTLRVLDQCGLRRAAEDHPPLTFLTTDTGADLERRLGELWDGAFQLETVSI